MVVTISPAIIARLEARASELDCTVDDLLSQWLDEEPAASEIASHAPYEKMLENSLDVIVLYDRALRHRYINATIEHLTGMSTQEIIGRKSSELDGVAGEDAHRWEAVLRTVFSSGQNMTFEFEWGEGEEKRTFEAHVMPIFGEDGSVEYVMGVTRDITARTRAEQELRASQLQLDLAQSIANIGYWEWNMQTGHVIWSDEFFRICGFAPRSIEPTRELGLSLIHPEDRERATAAIERAQQTGKPYHVEKRIVRPSGDTRWVLSDGRFTFDDAGNPLKLAGTFLDVTERRRDQERALQAVMEKMRIEIITRFIRDAAHEFRSPLTLITTPLYLLVRSEDTAKREEYAATITQQVDRIVRLVTMLTRIVELESHTVVLEQMVDVRSILSMLCQRISLRPNQATIDFIEPETGNIPHIVGSAEYIMDAFRHIIENAVRFTPPDGRITVRLQADDRNIYLKVEDTGIGIAAEDLPRIFETFWRKDDAHMTPGFGLGLPTARRAIRLHGGEIAVDSCENVGTSVYVTLPIEP